MTRTNSFVTPGRWLLLAALATLAACGRGEAPEEPAAQPPAAGSESTPDAGGDIAPGLSARILETGSGPVVSPGQIAVVHYTGWLYDESQPDNRGQKFDSSVDRGQHFRFPLGAGRVIRGWDEGVAGMRVGEVRELTIAPEMGYGERGAGNVIPPNATLVFEVELAGIVPNGDGGS